VRRRSDYAVYLMMRAALAGAAVMPRAVALACGAALARAARAMGMRRAVTDANLGVAFPELDPRARAQLARRVYAHFGRMAVDSLRLSARGPSAVVPHVSGGDCVRLIEERLPRGRGIIVLTGHLGNWELAGAYVAARGYRLAAVVKPPSNPWVARHADSVRRSLGIETIPMPEARTGVARALAENRVVALVADQGAVRSTVFAPFFGRPTRTPVGPGLFAARTGAPILFGALVAQPGGGYRLEGEVLAESVEGDADAVIQDVAERFRERLEALVRRYPDQYLWTHRLWKEETVPQPAAAR
jgi:KDO2-lipid IV(A) lauroyltransferase